MTTLTHTDPIPQLWSAARDLFARMRVAIGDAAAIQLRRALASRETQVMRDWLRALEGLVRKLVLIEATYIEIKPAPRLAPRRAATKAQAKTEQRRRPLAFRLWPRVVPHPARIRDLGPPLILRDLWRENRRLQRSAHLKAIRAPRMPEAERLARRIEALGRVLDKPLAAARRLARKLRDMPRLLMRLAAARAPRSPYANDAAQAKADVIATRRAIEKERKKYDTS